MLAHNLCAAPRHRIYVVALTDVARPVSFTQVTGNVGATAMTSGAEGAMFAAGQPLDAFRLRGPLSLMKVDAEGGKKDFLHGARDTLAHLQPALVMEVFRTVCPPCPSSWTTWGTSGAPRI